MNAETFAILAEPTRLRILETLRKSERSVGELVDRLDLPQPTVSKHLRVMREAGFVTSRVAAQRRIYRIKAERFRELDKWLAGYRRMWTRHLDRLGRHLDEKE
jgi:DNA-binding transcriptional ArsR family regulator